MIEIVTFRLAAGAEVAAFLAADQRVQTEFYYQQAGLVRRTTARGTGDEWLVLTIWGSDSDADAASRKAADDPIHAAFMSFVDASTVTIKRYEGLPG